MSETFRNFDDLPEGDGVLILSPGQVILSSTLQAERLLRRRLEHGQPLPLEHLFAESSLPQARLALQEAMEQGVMRANLMGQCRREPDGEFYLKYSIAPLYDHDGKIAGAILLLHDDTFTRGSAFGLEVEPEALLENLDQGVFIVNQRRRITAFNRMAQEITGHCPEEVLGRYCWEVFQADRCRTDCSLKSTLVDGITRRDQEVRIKNKEGQ